MTDTFLRETIESVIESGHSIEDILFIGSIETREFITWEQFYDMAYFEYDSGYGDHEIRLDLIINFKDGGRLCRIEYDGAECWCYHKVLEDTSNYTKLTRVLKS